MTPGGGDRGAEHDEHAPAPEAQEERVVQLQPGEQRADADDRGAGPERDRRVPERGFHAAVAAFLRVGVDLRRLVVGAVLDQDAVGLERRVRRRRRPVPLDHDRRAVLEQVGRVTVVVDDHGVLAVGHLEAHAVASSRAIESVDHRAGEAEARRALVACGCAPPR